MLIVGCSFFRDRQLAIDAAADATDDDDNDVSFQ